MSALDELYFQVYPAHSAAELHLFLQGYGIGICLTDEDRRRNECGLENAKAFLSRRWWEQQTGETLDAKTA